MTSNYQKYRCQGDELSDDFFNSRFKDLDARLNALEQVLGQLQDAADTLLRIGVERLNSAVNAALVDFTAKSESIQADAAALHTEVQSMETLVSGLLETLGTEFQLDEGTF